MIKTSEYVAPGHPDKVADGIVSFILDRYIEKDPSARFAMECQIKDNFVTLGGEVTSTAGFDAGDLARFVRQAVIGIGYTGDYADKWGRTNTIDPNALVVVSHVSQQSPDIAQGVDADGWGDQGIFWGMACADSSTDNMPLDHYLARKLGRTLYDAAKRGDLDIGLDIKTQVTTDCERVIQVIVAAPMRGEPERIERIRGEIATLARNVCGAGTEAEVIVNGTGAYVRHASQGDCGTTGRKLAVDFYGGNCRIGGGCPWGKDPSKADVTLNVYARAKAMEMMERTGMNLVYCAISCCIGRKDIRVSFFDEKLNNFANGTESLPARTVIAQLGLDAPVFAFKNECGLFANP